tara:strand:+ start:1807 stop:1947 length:141 start_codon:yes stop_codon:yes gene_type:complete
LLGNPRIIKANISHDSNSGIIIADENISSQEIIKIIQSTGFEASEK